jgi:hypothetical protein
MAQSYLEMPMPNPNTTTRDDFTKYYVRQTCPENADPKFRKLFVNLQKMLDLLANHDAMKPNLQQTYMTPANSKNKVYFM